jgi:hypothetical protein
VRGARKSSDGRRAPYGDSIAGAQVVLLLSVEGQDRRLVLRLELEDLIGIEHDGVAE